MYTRKVVMRRVAPWQERFWSKVDKTSEPNGCWLWTASKNVYGYGQLAINQTPQGAHRLSWELHFGAAPKGIRVDHRCHNPPCVNPEHLRLATPKQNQENLVGAYSNSKSGVRGVSPYKGRWRATVGHNYKQIAVGTFDTLELAEAAVIAKRNELFTHNTLDRIGN